VGNLTGFRDGERGMTIEGGDRSKPMACSEPALATSQQVPSRRGYDLQPDSSYWVAVGSSDSPALLTRLSPEDATILWTSPSEPCLGQRFSIALYHLDRKLLSVDAEVCRVWNDPRVEGRLVDLGFSGVSLDLARHILRQIEEMLELGLAVTASTIPLQNEIITDDDRIQGVLAAFVRASCTGVMTFRSGPPIEVTAVNYSSRHRVFSLRVQDVREELPTAIRMIGYNSIYEFAATGARLNQDDLQIVTPSEMSRVRHRRMRRTMTLVRATVVFQHPLCPQLSIERPMADLSRGGLSFWTDRSADVLYPGLVVHDLKIERWDSSSIHMDVEIRTISTAPGEGQVRCGLEIVDLTKRDRAEWDSFVDTHLYPTTQKGATWAELVWTLYECSKTFNIQSIPPEGRGILNGEFVATCQKLDSAPKVGCLIVWALPDRTLRGAQLALKMFDHSWVGFEVTKAPVVGFSETPDNVVRLDIRLRVYEHAQRDRTLRWVIGFHPTGVSGCLKRQIEDSARLAPADRAGLFRCHRVRVSIPAQETDGGSSEMDTGTGSVRVARPEEWTGLARLLGASRPSLYLEALDLVPERIDLVRTRQTWEAGGLRRDRAILVASRGDAPSAVAILESADDGLSLFPGVDGAWLYPFESGAEALFPLLVRESSVWYRARGKSSFVVYTDKRTLLLPERSSAEQSDLGELDISILAADLLPDVLESLWSEHSQHDGQL